MAAGLIRHASELHLRLFCLFREYGRVVGRIFPARLLIEAQVRGKLRELTRGAGSMCLGGLA